MAGYGVKDANRMLRAAKDSKPDSTSCKQCDDTGFVIQGVLGLRACSLCEVKDTQTDEGCGVSL
jgi:hypothetical protein